MIGFLDKIYVSFFGIWQILLVFIGFFDIYNDKQVNILQLERYFKEFGQVGLFVYMRIVCYYFNKSNFIKRILK